MWTSLRSRLLLSYAAVIATVLVLMALFLLAFSTLPRRVNISQEAQRLLRVSRATDRELTRWQLSNGDSKALLNLLDEVAQEQEVRILLVATEGRESPIQPILFDSRDNWQQHNFAFRRSEELLTDFPLPERHALGRYRPPEGGTWLALRHTLPAPPRTASLTLVYALPEPTPLLIFQQYFAQPLVRAGLASLLVAVLLAFIVARSVARPLQGMAHAAEAIAEGDYDQQLTPSGPREVYTLANSFNIMAQRVKQSQESQRDFVANVSHDLKTPLTSVQGWSQALLDGTAHSPAQQRRAAEVIHHDTARMTRLVNQLLDLAKIESGHFALRRERIDLRALVEQVIRSFAPRAHEQEIALTAALPESPALGLVDPDRVQQLLGNLLENALKHTPRNGRIEVRLTAETNALQLAVADTGEGIPSAELGRIFERFYQVDKSRATSAQGHKNAGLGLAIVKQLAEAHGGRVVAESTAGQGSLFTVWLPLGDPAGPSAR